MALPKYKDLINYELDEIDLQLVKAKKELLFLRIQKANFSRFSPHLMTHTRHQISQLLTRKRSLQTSSIRAK
ncbi:50S ribosomal protein L29 (chloroplast) [Nannochloropsis gaditana]|jgi:ribosomal protein L29|uniref:Ribosomal protein L29 n=2 Tax=Monodopsidaceae TaxID=425072 RepID=K9ZWJ0_9STRA|nr:50S ribosomal protein L29 [Nannochloropsis gaditana]YP_008519783.1 ribosomal protein L29 [Microchloropsis salina]AFZ64310.1 50S ribosomal protein L29 [Nannochloropsis gaditana]AGI98637.1 ribosomal protein L29 [Nannochloropsis gaditana]AGI99137.1 ribosomal protein L29 [Microchloropsis salina]AHX25162.1 50S ribosomal protein L29 [Nannochloropsis gaditana]AHX25563.1 50S ribosomal protein L29 [Microchloropsis salina]